MSKVQQIFAEMPQRYIAGRVSSPRTYYFSIGDIKRTVTVTPQACTVAEGKSEGADVVLKTTPELFERVVIQGKLPGPIDIARGRFKTNDPAGLQALKDLFRL